MKVLLAPISVVVLLTCLCVEAITNFDELEAASGHGHETGLSSKDKRCHEPLHLPLYDRFLGANAPKLLPSILKRRSPTREAPMVQLASRFKSEELESGLSESQDRFYTVGSFGPGPKQQILAKMLNIPQDVHLERLVVLAKDKSKNKPILVAHPVVIDTAHVFTKNDGKPAELNLELHDVKGSDNENFNLLTSQLNKELDAAIDTKKNLRGDSHLTPQEIDKIIEHVVEQIKKKTGILNLNKNNKELVGSTMDLSKLADSELDGDADGFKKKRKHKGSKKHGFIDKEDDIVGKKEDSVNFKDDVAEIPSQINESGSINNEALLGTKKGLKFGKLNKSKSYGKGKAEKYRQNGEFENSEEELEAIKNENPLHVDMTEDLGIENPENLKDIERLIEAENSNENDKEMSFVGSKIPINYSQGNKKNNHEINEDLDDSTLGTKLSGGYGNDYGHDKKMGFLKKMKKLKFGKKNNKDYYRENDENHFIEDASVGNSQGYQHQPVPQFQETQDGYQPAYQVPNQYAPSGNKQEYQAFQPTYEAPPAEYPSNMPFYQQVEPETYHSNGPVYPTPPSDNQYQTGYETNQYIAPMPQPVYKQSSYPAPVYQQPKQYAPMPTQVQGYQTPVAVQPVQPQAAYSSSKNYKSVDAPVDEIEETVEGIDAIDAEKPNSPLDDVLGSSKNLPEDPQLKASFLENEVKRLRQWISDNDPANIEKQATANHRQNDESSEKDELVDKFTKVIEHDLTDGKKLSPSEKKNLDKKIAKMVRENLNDQDEKDAKKKSLKKLEKLEELVEEEDDEKDPDQKLGSHIDDFKSRFSPKADEEREPDDEIAPKKMIGFGNLLKSSLDNLKKDKIIGSPKPLNLKNMVDSMPKLTDIMKSTNGPKLGSRSGMVDKTKKDSIVGDSSFNDKVIKSEQNARFHDEDEDDYEPEYHLDSHHHGGYNDYRSTEKKDDVLSNLEKLFQFNNHHGHKKAPIIEGHERSGEEDEPKTIPDIIKEIEENIEENLHLPPLPTLPPMRQSHRKHHQTPNSPGNIPQIQVNREQFFPNNNEPMPPPLPEMPPRGLPQPEFQSRAFSEPAHGPEHFNMPLPNQHIPRFQGFPQQGSQSFVGAPREPQGDARPPACDMTHFGKIVPEHIHDLHLRDVTDQMKKDRMYFVGDGIKLPLHMHKHEDGTFHLSVDLQKLCSKCNSTDFKNGKPVKEPDFISTNLLGSKHDEGKQDKDEAMNIEDVPLMMRTPNFDDNNDKEEHRMIKRNPKFNYPNNKSSESQSNEENDYMNPITQAIKDDVEQKINSFNEDIKEYYNNEADIKNEKLNNGNIRKFLTKRVRLLNNILGLLREVTFEN